MVVISLIKVSGMKKFICRNCGSVNEASDEAIASRDDWLQCTLPQGFEWILPAGKITPILGEPIYISGMGEHLSYDAYLRKYSIDPEIAYRLMRGRANSRGASLIGKLPQATTQVSSKAKSQNWLDDDDWTS
jgi:hypothetical protein